MTCTFSVQAVVPRPTMLGSGVNASMIRFAGPVMFATWSGFPPGGHPLPREGGGGVGAFAITAVGTDVASVRRRRRSSPRIRRRIVLPTSAEVSL